MGQTSPGPGRSGAKNIPNIVAGKNKVSIVYELPLSVIFTFFGVTQ